MRSTHSLIPLLVLSLLFACGSDGGTDTSGAVLDTAAVLASESPTVVADASADGEGSTTQVAEVRTIDGTGNHSDDLGAAGSAQRVSVPSAYADGVSSPSGQSRPSARAVSNAIAGQSQTTPDPQSRSAFVWAWGQFLDHDLDFTETNDDESLPIEVPTGDIYFDPTSTGTVTIPFSRSVAVEGSGTGTDNPRRQANEITSFIDGSQVYGSDATRAASLREFSGGRMRVSEGNLPPLAEGDQVDFLCGDIRASENLLLTSMQTLLLREHNRLAQRFALEDPTLDDEQIYQRSRKIVGALIQKVTYDEFLPALLGSDFLPDYRGYDATLDPSVSVLFSTAAYRMGHSQVTSTLYRRGADGAPISQGDIAVRDAFFQPHLLIDEGGIEPLLRGAAMHIQETTDPMVIDDLRNFLFGPPGSGGFDLLSLNLQRGRDHGLPDYNSIRGQFGLSILTSFAEVTSNVDRQTALSSVYSSVDDIDPWVGLLSEDAAANSAVGRTLKTILTDQFRRLRDGDRFWYQTDPGLASYLSEIEETTLKDIIERNTDIVGLNANVFFVANTSRQQGTTSNVRARQVIYPRTAPPSL